MDLQNIIGLLQHDSRPLERTQFCPADQEIAQYYEAAMPIADCERLQRHILDCAYCEARLGALERLQETGFFPRVDEELIASAKQMAVTAGPQKNRHAPAWAAAAVVVIALFTIINRNQESVLEPDTGQSVAPSTEESSRLLRSVNRDTGDLNVLIPAPGADPGAGMLPGSLIQWAEVPNNLHYNIFVLSRAGDVLWTERLVGTEWVLKEALHLAVGNEYYFRVEAQLPDGSSVSSKHLVFRVAERQ
jgi:hypothetical protein